MNGQIVAGVLAPCLPHLVYAQRSPRNEVHGECGWEELRWAFGRLRHSLDGLEFDTLLIHSSSWRTSTHTHYLDVPRLQGLSVDARFPHLFRFNYDARIDTTLGEQVRAAATRENLELLPMRTPEFRIDTATLVVADLIRPEWDKTILSLSSASTARLSSMEVQHAQMLQLGRATRAAIAASGRRVVCVAASGLSQNMFAREPELVEDMSQERIGDHNAYLWDMKVLELMRQGHTRQLAEVLADYTDQALAETERGGLSWLLAALNVPQRPAEVHGYGSILGTGNAVVEWRGEG